MTENEQVNNEQVTDIKDEFESALHNSSPALSSFNWTMGEEGEGDTLQIEVVLSKPESSESPTTHEMLSTLGNISVDELLETMIMSQAKKLEDEAANVEDAEFKEVDETDE